MVEQFFEKSYSQCGEDIIIRFIFNAIGISQPNFIDIGAHHPYYLSNTALFYEKGSRGINIEPDPELFKKIKNERPEDINLNIGIGEQPGKLDFYIMNVPTLNTFSKKEAQKYKDEGNFQIVKTKKVKVATIDQIIKKHCKGRFPDLLTLDAEGIDELVLNSINYQASAPKVICVETITFSTSGEGKKNKEIIKLLGGDHSQRLFQPLFPLALIF